MSLPRDMASPDNIFYINGIAFTKPEELGVETEIDGSLSILRLQNPDYPIEIHLLVGPFADVIQNATATRLTHYAPENGDLMETTREILGRTFLGAVAADTEVDSGAEITALIDKSGTNREGCQYFEKSYLIMADQSVFESNVLLFDGNSDQVAVIGCRASALLQDQVEEWKDQILQDLHFVS